MRKVEKFMRMYRKIFLAAGILAAVSMAAGCSQSGASKAPGVPYLEMRGQVAAPDMSGADIELLNIETPIEFSYGNFEGDMIFRLKDGQWQNPMSKMDPINQEMVQNMADNFLKLHAVSQVENPGAMGEYGLDNPAYTLFITDADKGEINISIGSQAADGTYYLTMDESKVYTVKPETVESLVFDYPSLVVRETIDLTVAPEDIKSASFTLDGKTTKYKTSDAEKMAALADALSRLKPEDFSTYYATEDELVSCELTTEDRAMFTAEINNGGEVQSLTLYAGGYTDVDREYRYMQLDGSNMVAVMEAGILETLVEFPAEE